MDSTRNSAKRGHFDDDVAGDQDKKRGRTTRDSEVSRLSDDTVESDFEDEIDFVNVDADELAKLEEQAGLTSQAQNLDWQSRIQLLRDCSGSRFLKRSHKARRAPIGGKWASEEDERLRAIVQQHGAKNWKEIATLLGRTRTDVQCLHRWNKVLRPGLHKGGWTEGEDMVVREMVMTHGIGRVKWSEIATKLHGRLGKQCRERWFNHLDPAINKGDWSDQEDLILYHAQKNFGNRWSEISKMLQGRTENAVKNRWNSSSLKRWMAETNHQPGPGVPVGPQDENGKALRRALHGFIMELNLLGIQMPHDETAALLGLDEIVGYSPSDYDSAYAAFVSSRGSDSHATTGIAAAAGSSSSSSYSAAGGGGGGGGKGGGGKGGGSGAGAPGESSAKKRTTSAAIETRAAAASSSSSSSGAGSGSAGSDGTTSSSSSSAAAASVVAGSLTSRMPVHLRPPPIVTSSNGARSFGLNLNTTNIGTGTGGSSSAGTSTGGHSNSAELHNTSSNGEHHDETTAELVELLYTFKSTPSPASINSRGKKNENSSSSSSSSAMVLPSDESLEAMVAACIDHDDDDDDSADLPEQQQHDIDPLDSSSQQSSKTKPKKGRGRPPGNAKGGGGKSSAGSAATGNKSGGTWSVGSSINSRSSSGSSNSASKKIDKGGSRIAGLSINTSDTIVPYAPLPSKTSTDHESMGTNPLAVPTENALQRVRQILHEQEQQPQTAIEEQVPLQLLPYFKLLNENSQRSLMRQLVERFQRTSFTPRNAMLPTPRFASAAEALGFDLPGFLSSPKNSGGTPLGAFDPNCFDEGGGEDSQDEFFTSPKWGSSLAAIGLSSPKWSSSSRHHHDHNGSDGTRKDDDESGSSCSSSSNSKAYLDAAVDAAVIVALQCATKSASAEQVLATLLSVAPTPFTPAGGLHSGGTIVPSPSQTALLSYSLGLHGLPVPPPAHIVPATSSMPPPVGGRTGSGLGPGLGSGRISSNNNSLPSISSIAAFNQSSGSSGVGLGVFVDQGVSLPRRLSRQTSQ